jgi:hypothetical protein
MPSVFELKQMCRNKGIKGYSKLNKKELVSLTSSKHTNKRRPTFAFHDHYTVEIILEYEGLNNQSQPTVQQVKKFIKDHSVEFLKEYLLDEPLNDMPDLSNHYYDFKYDSGIVSFKIPKNVLITDTEGKHLTIEDTVRLISELSISQVLLRSDNLVIRDLDDDEMGYISFSDVRLH